VNSIKPPDIFTRNPSAACNQTASQGKSEFCLGQDEKKEMTEGM